MITDTHLIYCCKQLVHLSLVYSSTKLKAPVHVASNSFTRQLVYSSTKLKLLSKDKVELAATLCTKYLVETISPVDTHHTHHWEEDTNTKTSRTLHVKWIELACLCPCVTSLYESKTINGCITQEEWITKLQ